MNYIKKRFFRTNHQTTSLEGLICPQNSDKQQKIKVFGWSVGGQLFEIFTFGQKWKALNYLFGDSSNFI